MLTIEHFNKQVDYYKSLTGIEPKRVYAYVREGNHTNFTLIPNEEFKEYEFVGYTSGKSFYPIVSKIST